MPKDIDATFAEVRNGVRSKDRVKDLGEVFTPDWIVKAMLDLVGEVGYEVETTFLEPSCGNGNFLVEILARKASTIRRRFEADRNGRRVQVDLLRAVATIYAIDISPGNVAEARARMLALTDELYRQILGQNAPEGYLMVCSGILARKIIVGDFLHRVGTIHDIRIGDDLKVTCVPHKLEDILPPPAEVTKRPKSRK